KSGSYLLYDGAIGTGGMLTIAEETLVKLARAREYQITTHLYGQEINPETYAICKADMLLKGEGENADHVVGGAEWSTLSNDAFPAQEFDFMLSNPPYGKSWKKDLETMCGKDGMRDPRFRVVHAGEELSLVTRSSDGQMLFLANMASKMNHKTKLGSRIAEVHNGSSLFTGDAGQGESNIRRWLIENDWLEAIVARPLRLHSQITPKAIASLRLASGDEDIRAELYERLGEPLFTDFAGLKTDLEKMLAEWGAGEGDEEDEGDDAPAKKGLPEKKK